MRPSAKTEIERALIGDDQSEVGSAERTEAVREMGHNSETSAGTHLLMCNRIPGECIRERWPSSRVRKSRR